MSPQQASGARDLDARSDIYALGCVTYEMLVRPYFLYDRTLLGELSRVAARPVTAFIRAAVGERDLWVGVVSSIQTHGSLANGHPHLHLLVTDGGGRPDGTFVRLPLHDVAILTEAFPPCRTQALRPPGPAR